MDSMHDPNIVTKSEFARQNDWSKSYISKLGSEGRLVLTDDGKVMAAESLQRIRETTYATERASAPALAPVVRADRDRKDFYDAENSRLDLEGRIGKLVSKADAIAIAADASVRLRTRLEAFAPRLAPQLAALGGNEQRIQAVLTNEVHALLDELNRRFAKLAELGVKGACDA